MSPAPIRIGHCLSLSGGLAANGQTAYLAHQIWQEQVNGGGGLLGREVELVVEDDCSDGAKVADLYDGLLNEQKVDLLVGGYGNNSISPAMPMVMEKGKLFIGLMGLGVNIEYKYDRYFAMIPTGTDPNAALTEGLFGAAARQTPRATTFGIVAADAPFAKNPIQGALANAAKHGIEMIRQTSYSLTTDEFDAPVREVAEAQPDILFFCSYLNDSIGLIRAIDASDFNPLVVGGAMIGPQSSAVQTQLGPLLNGICNYEYWMPTQAMAFPGVAELISTYQERARNTPADTLGYYVAPMAYAQLQVLEQAILATGSLDDGALADHIRTTTFSTVVGDIAFGALGEWAQPRVLSVQFRGIRSNDIAEFARPDARVVVAPDAYTSGELAVPYRAASGQA